MSPINSTDGFESPPLPANGSGAPSELDNAVFFGCFLCCGVLAFAVSVGAVKVLRAAKRGRGRVAKPAFTVAFLAAISAILVAVMLTGTLLCVLLPSPSMDLTFALSSLASVCGVLLLLPIGLAASATRQYYKHKRRAQDCGLQSRSWIFFLHHHWLLEDSDALVVARGRRGRRGQQPQQTSPQLQANDFPPSYAEVSQNGSIAVMPVQGTERTMSPLEKQLSLESVETLPPHFDQAVHI